MPDFTDEELAASDAAWDEIGRQNREKAEGKKNA